MNELCGHSFSTFFIFYSGLVLIISVIPSIVLIVDMACNLRY